MPVICTECGTELANGWVGPCPKCGGKVLGFSESTTNYSGTVTITGSTFSVFDVIIHARDMLASVAQSDEKRAQFVEPIIKQLDIAAEVTKRQGTALAFTRKMDLDEYSKKIEEYGGLIDKDAEENKFQKFFEENPVFLDPKVKAVMPKKSFGGEGYPDFVLILHDSSYLLVEIEKPSVRLFNNKGDPASELTHAQQQIRKYLRWAIEEKEFLRKRGCPNISADNIKGLVVIGKTTDLKADGLGKLENINAEVRSRYEIKTFDRILEENQAILGNLRKMA